MEVVLKSLPKEEYLSYNRLIDMIVEADRGSGRLFL